MGKGDGGRGKGDGVRAVATRARGSRVLPSSPVPLPPPLLVELYYWMRLTRTLEERLVALYRQTKVVGGLFRSLGQEADSVGSAYALERRDILSPLIRNLGSMLVKGATPVEILKQYMAKGDSPTRGRELNIHFGDTDRGFIGQISPLGDMVPVMAGVTLSFKMRRQDRVGLVYVGDGATSTGMTASHRYAAPGNYSVQLTVTDNAAASNSATTAVDASAPVVISLVYTQRVTGTVGGGGPVTAVTANGTPISFITGPGGSFEFTLSAATATTFSVVVSASGAAGTTATSTFSVVIP